MRHMMLIVSKNSYHKDIIANTFLPKIKNFATGFSIRQKKIFLRVNLVLSFHF